MVVKVLTGIGEEEPARESGFGTSSSACADTLGTLPEETDVGLGGGASVAPDGRGASECPVERAEKEAEDSAEDAELVGRAVPVPLEGAAPDGTAELGTSGPFVAVPFVAVPFVAVPFVAVPFTEVVPFPLPGTHPATRSVAVALAGPSVTATQPGKFASMAPGSSFSPETGFGAEQALFSSDVYKPLSNTGQSEMRPDAAVH